MSIIATEGQYSRLSSLIKYLDSSENQAVHKELVTVNEASGVTYQLGTVLGKITASGKYIVSKQAAVDGSQVPAVIYVANNFGEVKDVAIAATTDTKVLTLARGKAIVALEALKLDASFSSDAHKLFAYNSLKALGILVETSV